MSVNHGLIKKLNVVVFLAALIFCAYLNTSAQENTFKEEDLQARLKIALQKLEGKSYRMTTDYAFYKDDDSVPDFTEKIIDEFVPPEREHHLSETKTAKGIERYESIRIGAKQFVKYGSGEWKILDGSGSGTGNGMGNGGGNARIEQTVERRLKKGETVNNQTVDLYETIVTIRRIYPTNTQTQISRNSYWLNVNNMLVKAEDEYQNGERGTRSLNTKEYKYDQNIKIEAPIINKTPKP